jgi:hypothetical protein
MWESPKTVGANEPISLQARTMTAQMHTYGDQQFR